MYCTYNNEVYRIGRREHNLITLVRATGREVRNLEISHLPTCMELLFNRKGEELSTVAESSTLADLNLTALREVYIDEDKIEGKDNNGHIWKGELKIPLKAACMFKISQTYRIDRTEIGVLEDKCIMVGYGKDRLVIYIGDRL
ncbi:MAG: hypothetical protein GXO26_08015 [Crenarchaeota archaeon]|nr:hypothetical protein [Thermoproteota archaeon]